MVPNRIFTQLAVSVIAACLIVIVLHLTGLAPLFQHLERIGVELIGALPASRQQTILF
jgi:hypothetical protein